MGHHPRGEFWFLHFQDKGAYGRVVHLNPMTWVDDWPVIGSDPDGDHCGEPVTTHAKPDVGRTFPKATPPKTTSLTPPPWACNGNGTPTRRSPGVSPPGTSAFTG